MKSIAKPLARNMEKRVVVRIRPQVDSTGDSAFLLRLISSLDELLIAALHRWSIPALRIALGLVFIWFGALKAFGVSPVVGIIQQTYTLLPLHLLVLILGGWEMLIGSCLILKRALRCALTLMCVHLIGTFLALYLAPGLFFLKGTPFLLTADGEFVMKNIVLMAAALVIGGYEVKPLKRKMGRTLDWEIDD
jgi:putative oxidoreductase